MASKPEDDPSAAALDLDNDNYDSAEDSDFQLDDEAEIAGDDSGLSSEEEDDDDGAQDAGRPTKKRKLDAAHKQQQASRRRGQHEDHEMELDSGDEATILKAKSKISKKNNKKGAEDEDQEEGIDVLSDNEDGLFVKTRSMRMKM